MTYKIKSRIWIESDGQECLGEGKVGLLKLIAVTGSLSKAAKKMNISYKKAWTLIDDVNKSAKKAVTINTIGGKGGGGAELTEYGKCIIEAFEKINKNCWEFLDEQLEVLEQLDT